MCVCVCVHACVCILLYKFYPPPRHTPTGLSPVHTPSCTLPAEYTADFDLQVTIRARVYSPTLRSVHIHTTPHKLREACINSARENKEQTANTTVIIRTNAAMCVQVRTSNTQITYTSPPVRRSSTHTPYSYSKMVSMHR
jgi:hypothetical protein